MNYDELIRIHVLYNDMTSLWYQPTEDYICFSFIHSYVPWYAIDCLPNVDKVITIRHLIHAIQF